MWGARSSCNNRCHTHAYMCHAPLVVRGDAGAATHSNFSRACVFVVPSAVVEVDDSSHEQRRGDRYDWQPPWGCRNTRRHAVVAAPESHGRCVCRHEMMALVVVPTSIKEQMNVDGGCVARTKEWGTGTRYENHMRANNVSIFLSNSSNRRHNQARMFTNQSIDLEPRGTKCVLENVFSRRAG